MTRYYSKNLQEFAFESSPDNKCKQLAKKHSRFKFFEQVNEFYFFFKGTVQIRIDLKAHHSIVNIFLNLKMCGHVLTIRYLKESNKFLNVV